MTAAAPAPDTRPPTYTGCVDCLFVSHPEDVCAAIPLYECRRHAPETGS